MLAAALLDPVLGNLSAGYRAGPLPFLFSYLLYPLVHLLGGLLMLTAVLLGIQRASGDACGGGGEMNVCTLLVVLFPVILVLHVPFFLSFAPAAVPEEHDGHPGGGGSGER